MTTWILVAFVLLIFFVRDCFLLRMGPAGTTNARLTVYTVATLAFVTFLAAVTNSWTTDALGEFWSLPVTLSSLLFYGALLAICVWIRRSDRHHLAWQIAVSPNPVLGGGIALLARLLLPAHPPGASVLVAAAALAGLWTGVVSWWVWRKRGILMNVFELDFSVEFAGLISSATAVVSVLGLVLTSGWSGATIGAWPR